MQPAAFGILSAHSWKQGELPLLGVAVFGPASLCWHCQPAEMPTWKYLVTAGASGLRGPCLLHLGLVE